MLPLIAPTVGYIAIPPTRVSIQHPLYPGSVLAANYNYSSDYPRYSGAAVGMPNSEVPYAYDGEGVMDSRSSSVYTDGNEFSAALAAAGIRYREGLISDWEIRVPATAPPQEENLSGQLPNNFQDTTFPYQPIYDVPMWEYAGHDNDQGMESEQVHPAMDIVFDGAGQIHMPDMEYARSLGYHPMDPLVWIGGDNDNDNDNEGNQPSMHPAEAVHPLSDSDAYWDYIDQANQYYYQHGVEKGDWNEWYHEPWRGGGGSGGGGGGVSSSNARHVNSEEVYLDGLSSGDDGGEEFVTKYEEGEEEEATFNLHPTEEFLEFLRRNAERRSQMQKQAAQQRAAEKKKPKTKTKKEETKQEGKEKTNGNARATDNENEKSENGGDMSPNVAREEVMVPEDRTHEGKIERGKTLLAESFSELYGDATSRGVQELLSLEAVLNARFDQYYDKWKPVAWPNLEGV
jgi:hypothetical protein